MFIKFVFSSCISNEKHEWLYFLIIKRTLLSVIKRNGSALKVVRSGWPLGASNCVLRSVTDRGAAVDGRRLRLTGWNEPRKRPLTRVTLCYLDLMVTVHGSQMSINTNCAAFNAKVHFRKQKNALIYNRSQNPLISPERDLTYDVITSWPDISGGQKFQDMCQIDQQYCNESLLEIQRFFTRVIYEKP